MALADQEVLDDAFDVDELDGIVDRDSGMTDDAEKSAAQYGRLAESPVSASNVPGANTGIHAKARLWCVTFQQTGRQPPKGFAATITYGIGAAKYTRTVLHGTLNTAPAGISPPLPPYHVLVYGRYVDVAISATSGHAFSVFVSIAEAEGLAAAEYYAYEYFQLLGSGTGVLSGQVFTGQGVVTNSHVIYMTLAGAAGTPFYPMFFDATSLPANGTAPMLTLDALRQLGDGSSFEDESPGTLMVLTGLYFALSSTPDTLTVATSGAVVLPNTKVGF